MGEINIFEEYHIMGENSQGPEICKSKAEAVKIAKGKQIVSVIYKATTTYQLVEVVFGTGEVVDETFKDINQKGVYKVKEG